MSTDVSNVRPAASRAKHHSESWLPGRKSYWFHPARYRVAATLKAYETQLELHILKRKAEGSDWACKGRLLLHEAETAVARSDLLTAWPCLHAAKRIEAAEITDPAELAIRVLTTRVEASEKLSAWRREAVMKLLTPGEGEPVSAAALAEAMRIGHEDSDNFYYLMSLRKAQLTIPMIILCVTVASILLCAALGRLPTAARPTMDDPAVLFAVVQFGIMGASLSAVFSLVTYRGKIREHMLSSTITLLRPILGAAAALAIYAFMVSGALDMGSLTPGRVLAVAFAAGFSERLIIRTIDGLTHDKVPNEPKSS